MQKCALRCGSIRLLVTVGNLYLIRILRWANASLVVSFLLRQSATNQLGRSDFKSADLGGGCLCIGSPKQRQLCIGGDYTSTVGQKNGLPPRHGLLRSLPRLRRLTTYRDAYLYIFSKWVLDIVNDKDRLESISEDVFGWWAKAGWQAVDRHHPH